ncbi:FKBP-type peptidyl-prolyl cis-trans isomerase [uncultured archaeon]|nr:FKBP-type peptidyl-prolyl cis-trans isomerase [uncultured archaeon]
MTITNGDKVTLDYEGKFENGEIFDSSKHGDHSHPLTFVVGEKQVISGFENAVLGMKVDEEKEFTIAPEDAYGMPDERLFQEIPRQALPQSPEPEAGMALVMQTPQGNIPVMISEVKKDSVILNLNHPLAGKTLIFKIKILKVE